MTERERLLEKIRKVQAIANRGADGEKQSAAALLDRLMTQYSIDEAEIAEERLEKCFFRYKTPYERKLLVQVIYATTYLNPRFQKPLSGTTTHRRAGAEHMTGYTVLKNSCGPTTSHARRTPSGSGGPRDCRRPARRKCGTIRTAGF